MDNMRLVKDALAAEDNGGDAEVGDRVPFLAIVEVLLAQMKQGRQHATKLAALKWFLFLFRLGKMKQAQV